MSEIMWVRSHVERLLQKDWGVPELITDTDGDYPFRRGTAMGWITVMDGETPMVRVWAHALHGVKASAKLLRELNDIQLRTLTATILWSNGTVVVSQTVSPIGLTTPVLSQAVNSVGAVADDVGALLAVMYGGCTPYTLDTIESEDAA